MRNFGLWLSDSKDRNVDAVKVRVAAAKGLVGFDRRRKQKKQDKQDGVKRVVWLDEMDFNSEECVHRLLLPIPCSREGVCVCARVVLGRCIAVTLVL